MSVQYRPGDTFYCTFEISSATGAATDADALPTGDQVVNGAIPAGSAVTINHIETGVYCATGTLTGTAAYNVGDVAEILIRATIGGVAAKKTITTFRLVQWPTNALPNAASGAAGAVMTSGANTGPWTVSGGVTFSNAAGDGLTCSSTGGNGRGFVASGNGTGDGIRASGGGAGGSGVNATGGAVNSYGIIATGAGTGAGIRATGGATGQGAYFVGGGTSGQGILVSTTSGDGIAVTPTAGHAITATANGTSKHGLNVTGGTAGTSDGIHATAGTGGVDIRGNLTGNITGTLSTLATVWDTILSASSHNTANSAGQILRLINPNSDVIRSGTAQAGGASTITLDSGASAADNAYQWDVISISGGTGAGQSRIITSYVGASKVATVDSAWSTNPDATSTFAITPSAKAMVISYLTGQDPASLVLDVAQSAHNTAGTIGADIGAAAAGGGGGSAPTAAQVATAVWQDLTSGADFGVAGSVGALLKANLDTNIGSRLATAGYTAPPSAATIAAAVLTDTTDTTTAGSLGYLIGHAPSWYTAPTTPPTAAAIAAAVLTDTTDTTTVGSLGYLAANAPAWYAAPSSPAAIAQAVWVDINDLVSPPTGSAGAKLNATGTAGDPWAVSLPGSYTAGQAGYILGHNIDTQVSTRSAPATAQTVNWTTPIVFQAYTNLTAPTAMDALGAMFNFAVGPVNKHLDGTVDMLDPGNHANILYTWTAPDPVIVASNGLDQISTDGVNARQAIAMIYSVTTAGEASGFAAGTPGVGTFKAANDPTVTRLVVQTDGVGNRLSVTATPPN